MGDFWFGNDLRDEFKLVNYRGLRNGIQHRHNISPRDPEPDEAVTVKVVTSGKSVIQSVALYYTTDGSTPSRSRGIVVNGKVVFLERGKTEWDSILWDYVVHWQATIPGQPNGTMVYYEISGWSDNEEIFADYPDSDEQFHLALGIHYDSVSEDYRDLQTTHFTGDTIFCYHVDTHRVPDWAKDAVIYHLFVDRFNPGNGNDWLQTEDNNEVMGGTLWGVCEKLDYLADLGINCIWLTPTWVSETYHRYDIMDYRKTDPRLGGDEALRAVIEGAHKRGIRVLMDMVCNHMSHHHPIFEEALNNPDSAYRGWFHFDESLPDGYKTFMTFNIPSMPQINLNHPLARNWMIENAKYWLQEFGIDGFRLDVADGAGPNFWTHFRAACREINPECYTFGEVTDSPERLAVYAGRLDGNLAYPTWYLLRRTFGWETMNEQYLPSFMNLNTDYLPEDYVEPTFLDSADCSRFLFISENDTDKLKRAATYQFALPNPPIIFYGTEIGLNQQEHGPALERVPMIWDNKEWDIDLLNFYKELIAQRKQNGYRDRDS